MPRFTITLTERSTKKGKDMSPRGTEQNEKMRAEAKVRITKAALEAFAEYGFHGASMNQINQLSGLSKGLVYHYFPSKEKLFYHLVDSALEISKKTWDGAFAHPGTAWEKIEKLANNLVEISFTPENSRYYLIMVQAITQGNSIPGLLSYIQGQSAHFDKLPPLITEAQKSGQAAQGDPDVLAATFLALFQGYVIILYNNNSLINRIYPEIFTDILRNKAG